MKRWRPRGVTELPRRCWARPRRWWARDRPRPSCEGSERCGVALRSGGVHSISGVSSITSGMDTRGPQLDWEMMKSLRPGTGTRSKKQSGIASAAWQEWALDVGQVSGISSASLTPTPQLFQASAWKI